MLNFQAVFLHPFWNFASARPFAYSGDRQDGLVTPFLHQKLALNRASEAEGNLIFHGFSGGPSSRATKHLWFSD